MRRRGAVERTKAWRHRSFALSVWCVTDPRKCGRYCSAWLTAPPSQPRCTGHTLQHLRQDLAAEGLRTSQQHHEFGSWLALPKRLVRIWSPKSSICVALIRRLIHPTATLLPHQPTGRTHRSVCCHSNQRIVVWPFRPCKSFGTPTASFFGNFPYFSVGIVCSMSTWIDLRALSRKMRRKLGWGGRK